MYNQKDIVLVPFPYSDLTGIKQRPALIISNNRLNNSQDKICCLITSNPSNHGLKINNNSFKQGKLPFKSWVKPSRIFTIHEKIIKRKLCTINNEFHNQVFESINQILKEEGL